MSQLLNVGRRSICGAGNVFPGTPSTILFNLRGGGMTQTGFVTSDSPPFSGWLQFEGVNVNFDSITGIITLGVSGTIDLHYQVTLNIPAACSGSDQQFFVGVLSQAPGGTPTVSVVQPVACTGNDQTIIGFGKSLSVQAGGTLSIALFKRPVGDPAVVYFFRNLTTDFFNGVPFFGG